MPSIQVSGFNMFQPFLNIFWDIHLSPSFPETHLYPWPSGEHTIADASVYVELPDL